MRKKLLIIAAIFLIFLIGWFLFSNRDQAASNTTRTPVPGFQQSITPTSTAQVTVRPSATPASSSGSLVLINVPFAAQAPFGNWSDPRQQDGCEEASALMAMYWLQGKALNPTIAEREILAISDWEERTYGSYHDTSAEDTNKRILQGYFDYFDGEVRRGITLEDIKAELRQGNVMIVPMNGRLLGNPNFTPPGPERHMLIVIGYDPNTKQIITHDPGTRQGRLYRYSENVFFSAIRDYATGYHEPIPGGKNMIVVKAS